MDHSGQIKKKQNYWKKRQCLAAIEVWQENTIRSGRKADCLSKKLPEEYEINLLRPLKPLEENIKKYEKELDDLQKK